MVEWLFNTTKRKESLATNKAQLIFWKGSVTGGKAENLDNILASLLPNVIRP